MQNIYLPEEKENASKSQKRKAKPQDTPTSSPPTTSGGQQSSSDQQANQKRRKVGNQTPRFKPKLDAKSTEPGKISQTCSTPSFNSISLKGNSKPTANDKHPVIAKREPEWTPGLVAGRSGSIQDEQLIGRLADSRDNANKKGKVRPKHISLTPDSIAERETKLRRNQEK